MQDKQSLQYFKYLIRKYAWRNRSRLLSVINWPMRVYKRRIRQPKIFCIGLSKTGTTSLHTAFKILGYKSFHRPHYAIKQINKAKENGKRLVYYLEEYDVFSDRPFWRYYRELDRDYPGSKFILNTRGEKEWVESQLKHNQRWNIQHPFLSQRLVEKKGKKKLRNEYRQFYKQVRQYFGKRKDFIEFDVVGGDEWEKLCRFVGREVPRIPFPHLNKADR